MRTAEAARIDRAALAFLESRALLKGDGYRIGICKKQVLHGKLGYGGKGSNDEEEVIIIPIAVANPLSDFDFVVEALELAGADRERSM